ncbi:MAG TPA: hypothetical protein VF179_30710 [Thermoanaerobaculia bacterium]|nr:hypothetical protein [Thermoanaerobaculia bacterium]
MIGAAGRRLFDRLEARLPGLAVRHPRSAFSVAGALGSIRNRLSRRWPHPEQVRTLFPSLPRSEAARVAWRIAALEARNRLLVECIRREVLPLVETPEAFATLRPPLLLGTFHVGAIHALGPALEKLPGPVLALRQGRLYAAEPPVEVVSTEGDEQGRAAVFLRALNHLQAGGFVVTALDVVPGVGLAVPCLGRTLELARGPFALARLAGVPLVPLTARWQKGRVKVALGEALTASGEAELAAAAARWLDSYLLEFPGELGLGLLRSLLSSRPDPR